MYQTVAQSLATGTPIGVTFDTNEVDNYSGHSTSVNPSRYTAQVAGRYQCSGLVYFAASAGGSFRECWWSVNGTSKSGSASIISPTSSINQSVVASTRALFLNVGDYVELFAEQNSGGALSTSASAPANSMATVRWVGAT